MSKVISISEAATIAIHSMALIARANSSMNVIQIADRTGSSRHHVAKILQRLVKAGYLTSSRGPSGGFSLHIAPEQITLLQIYEVIEGTLVISTCPSDNPVCPFDKCIINNIVSRLTMQFKNHMNGLYLSDIANRRTNA